MTHFVNSLHPKSIQSLVLIKHGFCHINKCLVLPLSNTLVIHNPCLDVRSLKESNMRSLVLIHDMSWHMFILFFSFVASYIGSQVKKTLTYILNEIGTSSWHLVKN